MLRIQVEAAESGEADAIALLCFAKQIKTLLCHLAGGATDPPVVPKIHMPLAHVEVGQRRRFIGELEGQGADGDEVELLWRTKMGHRCCAAQPVLTACAQPRARQDVARRLQPFEEGRSVRLVVLSPRPHDQIHPLLLHGDLDGGPLGPPGLLGCDLASLGAPSGRADGAPRFRCQQQRVCPLFGAACALAAAVATRGRAALATRRSRRRSRRLLAGQLHRPEWRGAALRGGAHGQGRRRRRRRRRHERDEDASGAPARNLRAGAAAQQRLLVAEALLRGRGPLCVGHGEVASKRSVAAQWRPHGAAKPLARSLPP
mmetsp:Transcript_91228/g.279293  ORF Transcript_91228/g.279293 Transcript_91228/m.279293 type:complete len:316 (-) Transcript_91228:23-970(-)